MFHHNTMKKYTAALLSTFNDVEVQYSLSNGALKTKNIPLVYSSREKATILDSQTERQLLEGNLNVLPRGSLSFNGLNKAPQRTTNKNNKINVFNNKTDSALYSYNSVPYEFSYSLNFMCRGMNEATQIIEQLSPKFNPIVNIDIWDAENLSEPTRVPVKLLGITLETEEYEELSSNTVTIIFDLQITGNLYQPIKSLPRVEEFRVYLSRIIDEDSAIQEKMLSWNTDDMNTVLNSEMNLVNACEEYTSAGIEAALESLYISRFLRFDKYVKTLDVVNMVYGNGEDYFYSIPGYSTEVQPIESIAYIVYKDINHGPMEVYHYQDSQVTRVDYYEKVSDYNPDGTGMRAYTTFEYDINGNMTQTSYVDLTSSFDLYKYTQDSSITDIIYSDGTQAYYPVDSEPSAIAPADRVVVVLYGNSDNDGMDVTHYDDSGNIIRIDHYLDKSLYVSDGSGRDSYTVFEYTDGLLTSTIKYTLG